MRITHKQYSKYKNIKKDGYDSSKEARRATELRMMEKAGMIQDLKEQVTFELQPHFKYDGKMERSINYIADFTYTKNGQYIVEDVKSAFTKKLPVFRMKKKMLLYKNTNLIFIET